MYIYIISNNLGLQNYCKESIFITQGIKAYSKRKYVHFMYSTNLSILFLHCQKYRLI